MHGGAWDFGRARNMGESARNERSKVEGGKKEEEGEGGEIESSSTSPAEHAECV
jgi:hypothetical protein